MQTTSADPQVIGAGATQPHTFAGSGAERRLRETLAKKDKLVMALRDAIKQIGVLLWDLLHAVARRTSFNWAQKVTTRAESRLIESEKKNADGVMNTSLGRQVEKLSHLVACMKNEKSSLVAELHDERVNSSCLKRKLTDAMQETADMKNTV